jgi:hypothetical protein
MDDLSLALGEHGVNVRKPDYCESFLTFGEITLTIRPIGLTSIRSVSL